MTEKAISNIVVTICLIGWVPIYFFFGGIAKVIFAIKMNAINDNNKICEIKLENDSDKYEDE